MSDSESNKDLPTLRENIRREGSLPDGQAGWIDKFTEKVTWWLSPKDKGPNKSK